MRLRQPRSTAVLKTDLALSSECRAIHMNTVFREIPWLRQASETGRPSRTTSQIGRCRSDTVHVSFEGMSGSVRNRLRPVSHVTGQL